MNILVFDVGSSGMRGVLYNQHGKMLYFHKLQYNVIYLGEEKAEQNPEEWKNILYKIGSNIAEYCKEHNLTIDGISLTSQRASIIPVDRVGTPLHNAIMWLDKRNRAICESLKQYEEKIVSLAGAGINTVFSGSKMTWLKQNEREIYDKAYKIINVADYLAFIMTGEYRTDHTYASRTFLMDIRTRQWSDELLGLFEVDKNKLCELISPGDIHGYLKQTFANKTGLPAGIPLISAGGDQQCAALGLGVVNAGDMEITTGTGAFILAYCDKVPENLRPDVICGAHAVRGKYVLESSMLSCSSLYDWFRKNFYKEETANSNKYEKINEEIQNTPAGANQCIALPFFQGRGTPDWNNGATGVFANLTLSTTRQDMARAMLESIAYEAGNNIERLEAYAGAASQLFISGGLTNFKEFNQIQSDVYRKNLVQSKNPEQTALGAWVSAAAALKLYASYSDALRIAKEDDPVMVYRPNEQNYEIYQKQRTAMNRIYQKLNG
jgi:sugar (pentulose or hexulose) kinase